MPYVSIIVPVYNAEERVSKTIKSIMSQDFKNFELIIINDGSKDNSGLICDEFSTKDKRIRVFHQKNSGPAAARNKGIKEARGKYIAFIDADDTVHENWLGAMIDAQNEENVDLVCTGYNKVIYKNKELLRSLASIPVKTKYKNKREIKNNLECIIGSGFFNALWNKLYKAEIINKHNIAIDEEFNLGEDFLFNLDYIDKCESLLLLDVSLYNYIVNNEGLTHRYRENKFQLLDKVNEKYRKFLHANNMDIKTADFSTIRTCYSCFMDLFHVNNKMSFNEKLKNIESILDKKKVKKILERYKARNIKEKLLLLILKSNFTYLIYIVSWVCFTIKFKIKKE